MKTNSIGTKADSEANVDIAKVHGGYFSDQENLDAFIKIGITPIERELSKNIKYVDFGGGQGHLTKQVKEYLEEQGRLVDEIVADANETYINVAEKSGLKTRLCNLDETKFFNIDLITMRAVLHYNTPQYQKSILKNIFDSLKSGAYFVHQNSSGNKENCELRSFLVNIPELGRAGSGNYHWISEQENISLTQETGFSETIHAGYAKANSWGPEEQWDRFNSEVTKKALVDGDTRTLKNISEKREVYLEKAREIMAEYSKKYGAKYLGIKKDHENKIRIEYVYPITISRKP